MPTTHYLWDIENDSYLMEKDDVGTTTVVYTNEPEHFGKLVSQRRGNESTYYHFDSQESTRQITEQTGNVINVYAYSAFGAPQVSSGITSNSFRYVGAIGYYVDYETECIYVRSRILGPYAGRWHSFDPAGYKEGTNLFKYVRNSPLQLSDPSGRDFFDKQCVKACDTLFGKGAKDESTVWRAFCQALCIAARKCGGEKCKWMDDFCLEILINGGCSFCPSGEPFRSAHYKCMDIYRQVCSGRV